jgi:hypothetical protein
VSWKSFSKASPIGETWYLAHLAQTVLDREGIMSVALYALLYSNDIFKGECTAFARMTYNTDGDGYLALFQLERMVHPALGQATAQPQQHDFGHMLVDTSTID